MTPEFAMSLGKEAIEMALMVSLPILGIGMIVGLLVSIFQAVTQIQEMTLAFVPKILAVTLALVLFFPWILNKLMVFTENLILKIPQCIG